MLKIQRRVTVAFLCTLLLVVAGLIAMLVASTRTHALSQSAVGAATADARPSSSPLVAETARTLIDEPPHASTIVLHVTDTQGRPLGGVAVYVARPDERRIVGEPSAQTDEKGYARLSAVRKGASMTCCKSGYVTSTVCHDSASTRYDVTLEVAAEFRGHVIDDTGHPLEGAEVMASNQPLPSHDALSILPGHDAVGVGAAPIELGTSQADGMVVVRALHVGAVYFQAALKGYILLSAKPFPSRLPAPECEIVMAPIYVAAWKLRGDKVVRVCSQEFPVGMRSTYGGGFRAASREVGAELGATACECYVRDPSIKDVAGFFDRQKLSVEVLLERKGWHQFLVPLRAWSRDLQAWEVDASFLPDVPTGQLLLHFMNPSGAELRWSNKDIQGYTFELLPLEGETAHAARRLTVEPTAETMVLPIGEYLLSAEGPNVRGCIADHTTILVHAGLTESTVRLQRDLVPVRLTLTSRSGWRYQYGTYFVQYDDRTIRGMMYDNWPERLLILPAGKASISLSASGATVTRVCDIALPPSAPEQDIDFIEEE